MEVHLKLLIPCVAAGAIIGKGGEAVEMVKQITGARLKMSKANDFYPGTSERVCLIVGSFKACMQLVDYIMQKVHERPDPLLPSHSPPFHPPSSMAPNFITTERQNQLKILVPDNTVGVIIGKFGSFIKKVKESSGASIQISQRPRDIKLMERCVVITGDSKARHDAISMILSKLTEDPESSSFLNCSYTHVQESVASSAFSTGSPFPTVDNFGASHQLPVHPDLTRNYPNHQSDVVSPLRTTLPFYLGLSNPDIAQSLTPTVYQTIHPAFRVDSTPRINPTLLSTIPTQIPILPALDPSFNPASVNPHLFPSLPDSGAGTNSFCMQEYPHTLTLNNSILSPTVGVVLPSDYTQTPQFAPVMPPVFNGFDYFLQLLQNANTVSPSKVEYILGQPSNSFKTTSLSTDSADVSSYYRTNPVVNTPATTNNYLWDGIYPPTFGDKLINSAVIASVQSPLVMEQPTHVSMNQPSSSLPDNPHFSSSDASLIANQSNEQSVTCTLQDSISPPDIPLSQSIAVNSNSNSPPHLSTPHPTVCTTMGISNSFNHLSAVPSPSICINPQLSPLHLPYFQIPFSQLAVRSTLNHFGLPFSNVSPHLTISPLFPSHYPSSNYQYPTPIHLPTSEHHAHPPPPLPVDKCGLVIIGTMQKTPNSLPVVKFQPSSQLIVPVCSDSTSPSSGSSAACFVDNHTLKLDSILFPTSKSTTV